MDYYCARLLVVCLVEDGKPRTRNTCDRLFVVFRARDHNHALKRALALGKQQETSYKNAKGQRVRWAFVEVQNIQRLGRSVDGQEVGSFLDERRFGHPMPFKKRFNPRASRVIYE
jgi:hypothetical protein